MQQGLSECSDPQEPCQNIPYKKKKKKPAAFSLQVNYTDWVMPLVSKF
jgi:hypothetical protein